MTKMYCKNSLNNLWWSLYSAITKSFKVSIFSTFYTFSSFKATWGQFILPPLAYTSYSLARRSKQSMRSSSLTFLAIEWGTGPTAFSIWATCSLF
jgi:hypothetical protein